MCWIGGVTTVETFQKRKGERYRLRVVVEELQNATAEDYRTALLAFINCLVISTPVLKDRTRIRNEFIGGSSIFNPPLRVERSLGRRESNETIQVANIRFACRFEAPSDIERTAVSTARRRGFTWITLTD